MNFLIRLFVVTLFSAVCAGFLAVGFVLACGVYEGWLKHDFFLFAICATMTAAVIYVYVDFVAEVTDLP